MIEQYILNQIDIKKYRDTDRMIDVLIGFWKNIEIKCAFVPPYIRYIDRQDSWGLIDYQNHLDRIVADLIVEADQVKQKNRLRRDEVFAELDAIVKILAIEFPTLKYTINAHACRIFIEAGGENMQSVGRAPIWVPYVGLAFGGVFPNPNCNPCGYELNTLRELSQKMM
jgi:hypothetical protein